MTPTPHPKKGGGGKGGGGGGGGVGEEKTSRKGLTTSGVNETEQFRDRHRVPCQWALRTAPECRRVP